MAVAEKLKSHAETEGRSPGGWKTGDGSWAFMGFKDSESRVLGWNYRTLHSTDLKKKYYDVFCSMTVAQDSQSNKNESCRLSNVKINRG